MRAQKPKSSKNQLRQQFFCAKRRKFCFAFLEKIEIVLITPFTIVLNYAVSTLPLSNYFYPSISTPKTLWSNLQDKRLLTHGDFKNAGSKSVRCRFKSTEREAPWLWNPYFKRGLRNINRTYQYTSFVDCCHLTQ